MTRLMFVAALALQSACGPGNRPSEPPTADTYAAAAATQEIAEADLPDAVLAAVRSHRRAVLRRALKVTTGATTTYDLTLSGTRKTHMVVAADGRVISFE